MGRLSFVTDLVLILLSVASLAGFAAAASLAASSPDSKSSADRHTKENQLPVPMTLDIIEISLHILRGSFPKSNQP